MKKQRSLVIRSLLLSGVAAMMLSSCIFMPPKEKEETTKTENGVVQTPANNANNNTDNAGNQGNNSGNNTSGQGDNSNNGNLGGTSESPVQTKHGLSLVWNDEFNYTGVPNTSKWKYQTGDHGWGNQELQNYTDNTTVADTAVVEDGVLKIQAKYEDGEWKSARLNSKESWKYGYIEGKLKITDRKGAWPAFWMMPQNSVYGGWPDSGEIDIMENAPALENCDHLVFSTLHAEGHYAGDGKSIGSKRYTQSLSSEWHTFGVLWTEDEMIAYYDDVAVGGYENNGTVKDWPYDQKFYIILNLAIGGTLGGTSYVPSLNGNAEFQIDYIRVYQ